MKKKDWDEVEKQIDLEASNNKDNGEDAISLLFKRLY